MRKKGFFSSVLMLLVIGALGAAAYVFFKDLDGPVITVSPETDRISPASTLTITMTDPAGIRSLSVGIRKNNVVNTIFSKHFDEYLTERSVEVPFKDAGLREGAFELEIRATDASLAGFGQGNTRTELRSMRLDTQPPRISVKTLPPYVRRGGSTVIKYSIDEDVVASGVLVSGYFVPGYRQKDGSYICYFPFPYTMTAVQYKNAVEITATDLAGNTTRNRLTVMALERKFKSDSIAVSDEFLMNVQNKLGHLAPQAASPLECYLTINNNVRAANVEALRELSRDTVAGQLWSGTFARLPRSAPRAGFADHRFFSYQGKQVGESYHLGFDLASVRNADIPAANNGRVIFVGDMGIYGNLIVIDHGLGLMSLYSHCSEISVSKGTVVNKGDIIGKTGSTGLAFGDHLHFGILVGGVEVTPLEWLDAKWIRDNITDRLKNTQ
ncbi:M23 family metallopeptidase [uncultured Desulfovibrio sp.]|uniref:M23 family metallopeptidase n=1 Tax=Candidatus Desulfovibrio intestinavium TaxID=2838534 RepID=A0A9D2KRY1_9BACT|nr:M23 family metallopeptidase [uncultured Desulfovibrio sp.]HJA78871.1 M23 family metallopeptidase [Candidatus Desulfovibrio intestinavium]